MVDLIRGYLDAEHLLWEILGQTQTRIDFRPRNWRHWLQKLGLDGSNNWIYIRSDAEGRHFVDVERMAPEHGNLRRRLVVELTRRAPECGFEPHQQANGDREVAEAQLRVTGTEYFEGAIETRLRDLFLKVERLAAFLPPYGSAICGPAET